MNDDIVLQLAISAYNAYGDDAGWKTWNGNDMPQWDDLGVAVQSHWIAAVRAVINSSIAYFNTEQLLIAEGEAEFRYAPR